MEAQPAWGCIGPITVPRAVRASAPAHGSVAVLGRGDRGAMGREPSQEQGAGSHQKQDPVAQGPGSMAPFPQGLFSRGRACAPTLCHHKGVRGPVLGVVWEGTALLVGLQALSGRWPGRLYLQRWAEHRQQLGLPGAVSHQCSGCSHSCCRRVSTSHPRAQKEGSAPRKARLDGSPCSPERPALCPPALPPEGAATSPSRDPIHTEGWSCRQGQGLWVQQDTQGSASREAPGLC